MWVLVSEGAAAEISMFSFILSNEWSVWVAPGDAALDAGGQLSCFYGQRCTGFWQSYYAAEACY